jgi:uncharacterized damage-inducible protein DinB
VTIADTLISELEQEAKATRALLERVPDAKLGWKPHEKSMSLGQLANHVATTAGGVAQVGIAEATDVENFKPQPVPESSAALVAAFDESLTKAKSVLASLDDAAMAKTWTLRKGGKPMLTLPRANLFRSILLNHLYHHRGQLTVYLRLLDVPLPSIYGPTADENPFA